jgi:hypothetical protein
VTWLRQVRDPRQRPELCTYPIEYVLMLTLLMHCGQCGSRRQLGRELAGGRLSANVWRLIGRVASNVACHSDTLNNVMESLDPAQLEHLIGAVFERLRRSRALDAFRAEGMLVAAIDGTKLFTFRQRHCEHCTTQTHEGVTTYFHYVLAAKIVTPIGLVVPLAVEFIENPAGQFDKQDCELKAWRRLYAKLRERHPRLKLFVVGDGLYANDTTFADGERAGWNFAITLSEDKLPSVTAQLHPARAAWSGTRTTSVSDPKSGPLERTVRWQTPLTYHHETVHVIELEDTNERHERVYYNRWITNVKPDDHNAFDLAQTGRLRWKIENEGTNTQKHGGYEMGHLYGQHHHAWKNYYLLLQIAQLLNDLVKYGDYLGKLAANPTATFVAVFGTMRNFAKRLIDQLRHHLLDPDPPVADLQIRLLRC